MNRKEIDFYISTTYPDIPFLFADGFDEAIIGVAQTFHSFSIAYDKNKCIEVLMKETDFTQSMSEEEAIEYFDYNVVGSYVGEHTPTFIEIIKE
jgi:hypothetical protein